MSFIRGVLLAGRFRSFEELNGMSHEDQRNTLIVELAGRTNQPVAHYQGLDDAALKVRERRSSSCARSGRAPMNNSGRSATMPAQPPDHRDR